MFWVSWLLLSKLFSGLLFGCVGWVVCVVKLGVMVFGD